MPVSVDQLAGKTRPLTVDLGDGDELKIVYRPSKATAEFEANVNRKVALNDVDAVGGAIVELLVEWDAFEDAKQTKKVPLTAERLRTFPLFVLAAISDAVSQDLRPNRKSATPSGNGSLA